MKKIQLIAFIGPSGCGKDTIINHLLSKSKYFSKIILTTTRPPRGNEQNNIDYYFTDEDHWCDNEYIYEQKFQVTDKDLWRYGIREDKLEKNKINLVVLTPYAIEEIEKKYSDIINLIIFYVKTDDRTRLMRQLRRESNPNCHEICRRFISDEGDFKNLNFHYFVIFNDYGEINAISEEVMNIIQDILVE